MDLIGKLLQRRELLILDGAMGTDLLRRGVSTKLPLWSATALVEAPSVVEEIHFDNIVAGADIITTNSFRTNVRVVEYPGSPHKSRDLTLKSCELAFAARDRAGRPEVLVAGCLAPVEDCYCPELVPEAEVLFEEHRVVADALREAGVDFIFSETMNCVREAVATAEAACGVGMRLALSFVCTPAGVLLSGESLASAVQALARFEPLFLGVNCRPPAEIEGGLKQLLQAAACPVAVYANGEGCPNDQNGWAFPSGLGTAATRYVGFAERWRSMGAKIIGGCCGTTPEYIRALADALKPHSKNPLSQVASQDQ